jgi:hypothetical protein
MSFVTRLVPLFALLVTAFCGPALAWDYEVGTSLVCDTRAQVERFAVLFSGDAPAAIQAINTEEQNPSACALLDVVYVRGAQIAMARHGDNAFEVVRILVVGIATDSGIRPLRPAAYFSLFHVKELAV